MSLPLDIYFLLAENYLEPAAVLSLSRVCLIFMHTLTTLNQNQSQTSRTMYELMNSPRLWRRLALDIVKKDYLIPQSVPLESISLKEIKQFATLAFRMERLFDTIDWDARYGCDTGSGSGPVMLFSRSQHVSLSFNHKRQEVNRISIQLLPGGRWVVGLARVNNEVRLVCWDIFDARQGGDYFFPETSIDGSESIPENAQGMPHFKAQHNELDHCATILLTYATIAGSDPYVYLPSMFMTFTEEVFYMSLAMAST